jgi:hypothetical protein
MHEPKLHTILKDTVTVPLTNKKTSVAEKEKKKKQTPDFCKRVKYKNSLKKVQKKLQFE